MPAKAAPFTGPRSRSSGPAASPRFLPALRTDGPRSARADLAAFRAANRRQAPSDDGRLEEQHSVLPSGVLDAAPSDPIAMLALEDWMQGHGEGPMKSGGYESRLLFCESQLRKLDRLALRLRPPNPVVSALVCDLLHRTLETLPGPLQSICGEFMRHIESAVYSDERMSKADVAQLTKVVDRKMDKVPHFMVARRQKEVLERLEKQAGEMQSVVDGHLSRRKRVLGFIVRLQGEERIVLQRWLFQFWTVTYMQRRGRIEKMANVILTTPQDIVTPFISWRLHVSQIRLERARVECDALDDEASGMANRITEVEIQNEEQQTKLNASLEEIAELKKRCENEQQEHARLQKMWDATQPELLLSVLAMSLEFLFGLIVRAARFSGLEVRERLAKKDAAPLLESVGLAAGSASPGSSSSRAHERQAERVLLSWVNTVLLSGSEEARKLLESSLPGEVLSDPERTRLEIAIKQKEIDNPSDDLRDSTALCLLFAHLKAAHDNRAFSPKDLWPLDERDLDLRAAHFCSALPTYLPGLRTRCLLVPADIVGGKVSLICSVLAAAFLKQPGVLVDVDMSSLGLEETAHHRERLEEVISNMETCAGPGASEPMEDPTPLLHGGEDYHALAAISTEQLLLRWANVQLKGLYHRPVENFGSDLQDGEALDLLLRAVAPETSQGEDLSQDVEERLDRIVAAAAHCTDFELLTPAAILECQSDILAAFLAQLFLARPSLSARDDSLLAMHLRLLEELCRTGYDVLRQPAESADVMPLCSDLQARWSEIVLAVQTVQEANDTMKGMASRMRAFLGDTLAHRAQGRPRTMLDAKEAREFLLYTSLGLDRLQGSLAKESLDGASAARVEDLLRRHFRLLRDVFRHYAAVQTGGGGAGITVEGLLKLYQDCKLRSRDLAPHHLEGIFYDHLDTIRSAERPSAERTLSPQGFVEVMLQCANLKFKSTIDHLPDRFSALVDYHLKPHACQETGSLFQRMAYDPKVREVLSSHIRELQIVFKIYASLDASSAEAMQKVNTMNISEFQLLLVHCQILDDTLTESAVQQIFDGIQQSATDGVVEPGVVAEAPGPGGAAKSGTPEPEGLDDDDELAFSEFLDGLVAVAAYKYPDPFTPLRSRVDALILDVFAALRRHWSRKRVSPQVDEMLNALQKKLR